MAITLDQSANPKELLDEANGASVPASSAWLAFLFLLAYVVVTLAGVSHKALLLNSPVKLPIINADIPLVGFFQYAPAMLLLVYLSLLVQHVILSRKYRKFTDAIAPYEMETGSQHPARERVQSYVFSQMLAGPEPNRITKFMMLLIVYVTFAILPVITLLYFQIKFLPYHEVTITYWHRIAVISAFAMLILLIPIMQHVPPKRKWDIRSRAAGGGLGGFGHSSGRGHDPVAGCRRLQLADRHRSRRMDRPASWLCRSDKRPWRGGGRGEAVEPVRAPHRLRPPAK